MAYSNHHEDQPEDRLEDPGEEKIGESNIINIIVITDNKMSYHGCHLQHSLLIKNSLKYTNIYIDIIWLG